MGHFIQQVNSYVMFWVHDDLLIMTYLLVFLGPTYPICYTVSMVACNYTSFDNKSNVYMYKYLFVDYLQLSRKGAFVNRS